MNWKVISLALALAGLFAIKMVAFEPYVLGVSGLRVHLAAVLLPLAMLFGWAGIGGFSAACAIAHLLLPDSLGIADSLGAGLSVLASSTLAYQVYSQGRSPLYLLAGSWVMVGGVSLGFGIYSSLLTGSALDASIVNVFYNVWIPIGILGYSLAWLTARLLRPVIEPVGSSRG